MIENIWRGVLPAVTTPFDLDGGIDHAVFEAHCAWLADRGCSGIVTPGSLGEGATLTDVERAALWDSAVRAVAGRIPVIAAIASASTAHAAGVAKEARHARCRGLMVLPPYVYRGSWRETRAHFAAIMNSTDLPCMLYNNPVAYGTDVLPAQAAELAADHPNLLAVKESSPDPARIGSLRRALPDSVEVLVGLDELLVEGVSGGARGWIAGLANAFPQESVALFQHAAAGRREEAIRLNDWFLPLLKMDSEPEFVQLIKLVQQEAAPAVGAPTPGYTERVRLPRLPPDGPARAAALNTIRAALASRPVIAARAR